MWELRESFVRRILLGCSGASLQISDLFAMLMGVWLIFVGLPTIGDQCSTVVVKFRLHSLEEFC